MYIIKVEDEVLGGSGGVNSERPPVTYYSSSGFRRLLSEVETGADASLSHAPGFGGGGTRA
jgi:hypothetical protein